LFTFLLFLSIIPTFSTDDVLTFTLLWNQELSDTDAAAFDVDRSKMGEEEEEEKKPEPSIS
jgi:hypothetical protein